MDPEGSRPDFQRVRRVPRPYRGLHHRLRAVVLAACLEPRPGLHLARARGIDPGTGDNGEPVLQLDLERPFGGRDDLFISALGCFVLFYA